MYFTFLWPPKSLYILPSSSSNQSLLKHSSHCVKYRNFTKFPGLEILWKGTIELPETLWKLCLGTKFLHQEIGWNFNILCSVNFFMDFQKPIYLSFFSSHQSFHIFHFYIASAKSVYPTSAFSILPPSNTTNIWQPHQQLLSCYSLHLTSYCRSTLIVLPLQQAFHTTTQSHPTFSWQYLPSTPSCLFFPDPADHIL